MVGKLYELHSKWGSGLWGMRFCKLEGRQKPKWIYTGHVMLCIDKKLMTSRFVATNGMYFLFYNSHDSQIYMFQEERVHDYLVQV